jgi:hypothetical protein
MIINNSSVIFKQFLAVPKHFSSLQNFQGTQPHNLVATADDSPVVKCLRREYNSRSKVKNAYRYTFCSPYVFVDRTPSKFCLCCNSLI